MESSKEISGYTDAAQRTSLDHLQIVGKRCNNLSYDALKCATISWLNHDINEERLAAHEQLTPRYFQESGKSINRLTQDIKKLQHRSSLGLLTEVCDSKLRFYLMNALPETAALVLNLLPKGTYAEIMAKNGEIILVYQKAKLTQPRVLGSPRIWKTP